MKDSKIARFLIGLEIFCYRLLGPLGKLFFGEMPPHKLQDYYLYNQKKNNIYYPLCLPI